MLIVLNVRRHRLKTFDSLYNSGSADKFIPSLRKFFVEYFAHHKRDDLEVGSWEVRTWRLGEIPMQTNKIDCGVFKCMFASAIVLGLDVNFGQVNINSLRRRMAPTIIDQKLAL